MEIFQSTQIELLVQVSNYGGYTTNLDAEQGRQIVRYLFEINKHTCSLFITLRDEHCPASVKLEELIPLSAHPTDLTWIINLFMINSLLNIEHTKPCKFLIW